MNRHRHPAPARRIARVRSPRPTPRWDLVLLAVLAVAAAVGIHDPPRS